ncbi:MAG: hypothetical protein WBM86_21695 [Waterburya sp.]
MLFNPEINSIEEDILYHQTQITEAQERLDQVKMSAAFSDTVISSLEDFLDNTDPFLYEVLRGHINQMFDENKLTLNNEVKEGDPNYKSIEQLQQEEPDAVVAVFHSEEHLKSKGITPTTKEVNKEFGPLSYYELTGHPDTRPDTFTDLAPNITYSSSGRAYVGFHDRVEAEEFRDSISEPAMLSNSETMNGYKYEVKFYCDLEYLQQFIEDPLEVVKSNPKYGKAKLTEEIYYDASKATCYIGFSNRERANTYGAHLKEIHELYDSKYTVDKPCVVTHCKHELVIEHISYENAQKLAKLNLKKDLDYKTNKAVTDSWKVEEVLTEDVQIYVPPTDKADSFVAASPARRVADEAKKSEDLSEKDFPSYPYAEIPLTEVEFGDVITSTPHSRSAYMVKEHKGEFVLAECLYHKSLPARIGEEYSFSKIYLVEKCNQEVMAADSQSSSELCAV